MTISFSIMATSIISTLLHFLVFLHLPSVLYLCCSWGLSGDAVESAVLSVSGVLHLALRLWLAGDQGKDLWGAAWSLGHELMLHAHALGAMLARTAMQWIMDSSASPERLRPCTTTWIQCGRYTSSQFLSLLRYVVKTVLTRLSLEWVHSGTFMVHSHGIRWVFWPPTLSSGHGQFKRPWLLCCSLPLAVPASSKVSLQYFACHCPSWCVHILFFIPSKLLQPMPLTQSFLDLALPAHSPHSGAKSVAFVCTGLPFVHCGIPLAPCHCIFGCIWV